MVEILIAKVDGAEDLLLPRYMTEDASGMDLCAHLKEPLLLEPGKRVLVPLGFQMALPRGYEAQIRPRSGLAYKHGITCLNSPGTIDADYRGEVKVLLANLGDKDFEINHGDRIAQMVIQESIQAKITLSESLPETLRADGGFGSTGKGN